MPPTDPLSSRAMLIPQPPVSPARKNPSKLRLEGMLRGAPLTGPETLHLDLSNRCNTRCVTCWDHSPFLTEPRSPEWKRQIMSWDAFCTILDQAEALGGVSRLILSGMGDPLTHPLIYELIAEARARRLHVTVLTNLLLAEPSSLIAADPNVLLISINGVSAASHAAFHAEETGHSFERLCKLLKTLLNTSIQTRHVQVISRETCDELPEMVTFAAQYRAEQITFKLASLGAGTEAVALSPEQRLSLLQQGIPEALQRAQRLGVQTNLETFALQLQAEGLATTPIESVGCYIGYTYARITVDLTVLYCCAAALEVGTLRNGESLSDLWYSPTWQGIRAGLAAGQYYPCCQQCGKFNQNVKLARKVRQRRQE